MTAGQPVICYYCFQYAELSSNFPLNTARYNMNSETPRCQIHWQYECERCGKNIHFNGIAWCHQCQTFTCVNCAEEKMIVEKFLIYDYYYNIPCHRCGGRNPALDYAEYRGTHPVQTRSFAFNEKVTIWVPINEESPVATEYPHPAWGSERVLEMGGSPTFEKLDSLDEYNPKSIWDDLAPEWAPQFVEGGDFHHKQMILPHVYHLLDVQPGDRVLDVACGEGNVSRHLARMGARVTGIDISRMLEFARKNEELKPLGIDFLQLNATELASYFEASSFDKVVCNMAFMDIADFESTMKQISTVLKEEGVFVFSITHPAFAYPACMSLRIPHDSQRNEDKTRVVLDYFDERPTVIQLGEFSPLLHFPRSISKYLNELVKNSLMFQEMIEPQASKELVEQYPRHAYIDYENHPDFLIVKAIKKSKM